MDLFGYDVAIINARDVAGVDEVGRGPLAGPVVAAAVVLDPNRPIANLADSKVLTAKQREVLDEEIRRLSLAWALGRAEVGEIDRLNILRASLLAMRRAVTSLAVAVKVAYVDGNIAPSLPCATVTVVGGDAKVPAISAASIIAKVARDREMSDFAGRFPEYGFERHKGYATPEHLAALKRVGPCEIHRRSFAPIRTPENPTQLEFA
ncbi:MAG: ribonuclease HII [Gammaproteobacteria bacterium]|nr:ribonuclease HII [Gammaproteobacteria bacterium]